MRHLTVKTIVIFSLLIYACSGTKQPQITPVAAQAVSVDTTPVVVIANQNEVKSLTLHPNQKFDILFNKECVGCADIWRLITFDKDKVNLLNESYAHWTGEGKPAGFSGGSQEHSFHFEAKARGESALSFKYFDYTYQLNLEVK